MESRRPISNVEEWKDDIELLSFEVFKACKVDIHKEVTLYEALLLTTEVATMEEEEKKKRLGLLKIQENSKPASRIQRKRLQFMARMLTVVCRC